MSNAPPGYISGLDIGQAQDHTALAVLELTHAPDPARQGKRLPCFAVRHLRRFPLGTGYPEVVAYLAWAFAGPPLAGSTLAVDRTGVGRPVVEMLRQANLGATIRPVTITAGHQATPSQGGGSNVPKRELVSTLQVLLQSRRLRIAVSLAEAPALLKELETFKVKVTAAATEAFEAWREGDHDDLVMAVALAVGLGRLPAPSSTPKSAAAPGAARGAAVVLEQPAEALLADDVLQPNHLRRLGQRSEAEWPPEHPESESRYVRGANDAPRTCARRATFPGFVSLSLAPTRASGHDPPHPLPRCQPNQPSPRPLAPIASRRKRWNHQPGLR
jgi:hypothetical protein